MGRGRAKAKQTKVARRLKYDTHDPDLSKLQQELGSGSPESVDEVDESDDFEDDDDPYAAYADYVAEQDEDEEDEPQARRRA